jgi:hypothetical protein
MLPSLALLIPLGVLPAAQADLELSRARTTVLHLADGSVIRARAVLRGADWEVFSSGAWRLVPAGAVVRAKSERELLDQAAKLERGLARDDHVRRVAYADWLVSEGLFVEALEQLDRVLEHAPDHEAALALIARADLPLALPPVPDEEAELEPYFGACARMTASGRETAVARLARAPEIPGLRPALSRELVARTPGRRAFATLVLRRMFAGAEVEGLLSRAVLDSSAEVRAGAALALKAAKNPLVIEPVLRAVGSKHAVVRENAIEALGAMDYREAVEPLYGHLVALQSGGGGGAPRVHIFTGRQRAYVQDFDVEVAQFSAIADPIINILTEGQVLDVAVRGVTEFQVAGERAAVRGALGKLTGANPGETTAAWQRWWKEHGGDWRAGASLPEAPTSPTGQG